MLVNKYFLIASNVGDVASMNMLSRDYVMLIVGIVCLSLAFDAHAGGTNIPFDRFTNIGSIINTRHNMTQNSAPLIVTSMSNFRNDYGEVCVYCHTPHGANQVATAPLWNRTIKATSYKTYNQLGTSSLTQAVVQPGGSSLTCLSCHDGQTAIDSIINMPGSWRRQIGQATQATIQSTTFLNTWNNTSGTDATKHMGLNSTNGVLGDGTGNNGLGTGGVGCLVCHSETGFLPGTGPDFSMFNLGTDLRNDHPVGVTFPTTNGAGTDWNTPSGVQGSARYFDTAGGISGKMDKVDIRVYGANQGGAVGAASPTVECASCHDPHGVPDPTNGNKFKPTFLRVNNVGSAVCLTCHTK